MALLSNYTVLYDKKTDMWVVRRHGSIKKSDAFATQVEAIARAKVLAEKSGGSVNIKNKEGIVRKQAMKSNRK